VIVTVPFAADGHRIRPRLRDWEAVPDEVLRYVAMQLAVPAEVYPDYGRRLQTGFVTLSSVAAR
jgi:hypothetical protein